MITIWEYLNGKKTNIGAGLAFLATVLTALGIVWNLPQFAWWPKIIQSVEIISGVFSGTGLIHKAIKGSGAAT